MSMNHQRNSDNPSFVARFCSCPRVQRVVNRSKRVMGNALQIYNHGLKVSKANARDTLNEMGKFFSVQDAKAAFVYNKALAKEVHEELVGRRVRLLSTTVRTVFDSQAKSLFDRNHFAVDNSSEDDSEDQE